MRSWNELSMAEKADVMKLAIEGGVYDLNAIRSGYNDYARGGRIHIKPENRGKFTALKERTGHSATWFKEHGTPAQKKMATFALNAKHWKHEDGGLLGAALETNENNIMAHGGELSNYYDGFGSFANTLRKGWNWIKNAAQVGAIAENPAVMTAAGYRVNRTGRAVQDKQNDAEIKQLRENIANIGEAGVAAPTLTGDIEAAYQIVRHPMQTVGNIKNAAKIFGRKKSNLVTKETILRDINQAKEYKESKGYRGLVEQFIEDTGETDIPVDAFYSSRNPQTPSIVLEQRPKGHIGGYKYSENKLSIDPVQTVDDVPFHEGLHWQRIGRPEVEKGPDYAAWVKALNDDAPTEIKDALWNKYAYSEIGESSMRQGDAIRNLYNKKVRDAVYPETKNNSEMWKPNELLAHPFGVGKSLGLEPFQEYPGMKKALGIINEARKKDPYLWDIRADKEEEVKNFWKLLTGNYAPTVAGASIIGTNQINR